jgi:hypothetical protein
MNMGAPFEDCSVDIATLDLWDDSRITISPNGWLTIFGRRLHEFSWDVMSSLPVDLSGNVRVAGGKGRHDL